MKAFAKFLANYADEALGIGKALTDLLDGVVLKPEQAKSIESVITKLENAHANIVRDLEENPDKVVIAKEDIEAIVIEWLNTNAPALIARAMPGKLPE